MKLNADVLSGAENRITAYDENYVMVNQQRFESSVIVLSDRVEDWRAASFEDLKREHFEFLTSLRPEIVLLGTGKKLRFPPPHLSQSLVDAQVGLEVMDTRAACRTYNILTAEGRRVAAALLIETQP